MSAYVLSDEHLDAILTGFKLNLISDSISVKGKMILLDSDKALSDVGQILKDENYRSVNARYNEKELSTQYQYKVANKYSPVELLKLCDCYDYQACKAGDYTETLACEVIDCIRRRLIKLLPGYDDAMWGI